MERQYMQLVMLNIFEVVQFGVEILFRRSVQSFR